VIGYFGTTLIHKQILTLWKWNDHFRLCQLHLKTEKYVYALEKNNQKQYQYKSVVMMTSRCWIANTHSSQPTVPHSGTRLKLSKALYPNYTTKTTKSFQKKEGGKNIHLPLTVPYNEESYHGKRIFCIPFRLHDFFKIITHTSSESTDFWDVMLCNPVHRYHNQTTGGRKRINVGWKEWKFW